MSIRIVGMVGAVTIPDYYFRDGLEMAICPPFTTFDPPWSMIFDPTADQGCTTIR